MWKNFLQDSIDPNIFHNFRGYGTWKKILEPDSMKKICGLGNMKNLKKNNKLN